MMSNSKPTLGYWEIRGMGQPIRFLLAYLQVDYIDKRYSYQNHAEWFEHDKPNLQLDFPNLPYWIDQNVKLTETRAILKYLARVYGSNHTQLIPNSSEAIEASVNMLECVIYELWWCLIRSCAHNYTDEAKTHLLSSVQSKFDQLSKYLGLKQFIFGTHISYLDFVLYEVLYHYTRFDADYLKSNPNLEEFKERFEQIPAIKSYIASDKYISKPCINLVFRLN